VVGRSSGSGARQLTETRQLDFDGHRLAYRVAGDGPALVVLSLYRRRADVPQARLLSDRWRVFQVHPLGYGYSERVPGYAGEALVDQVLAVLDHHAVDRFVVWGISKGGAMAACIARATTRTAGLVTGAFSLHHPTDAQMRRMDRRLRPDHPSRALWAWVKRFDWVEELLVMPCPGLLYWGSEDRNHAPGLRRTRDLLNGDDLEFVEFPGLGHEVGGEPQHITNSVVPMVVDWTARRLGPSW
jgi:pimeloyl-ACP methyl ester carboxylesterase